MPTEKVNLILDTKFQGSSAVSAAEKLADAFKQTEAAAEKFSAAATENIDTLKDNSRALDENTESSKSGVRSYELLASAAEKSITIFKSLAAAITGSVGSIIESNRRTDKLAFTLTSLDSATQVSSENIDKFTRFIDRLSLASGTGTQDIATFAKALVDVGESERQTGEVLIAATNLATVSGREFSEIAAAIQASYLGSSIELERLNISASQFTEEQLKTGAAARLLTKEYGGQITSFMSLSTLVDSIKNAWEIFFDLVVDTVSSNETLLTALQNAFVTIAGMALELLESETLVDDIADIVDRIFKTIKFIVDAVILIPDALTSGFIALDLTIRNIFGFIGRVFNRVSKFLGFISEKDLLERTNKSLALVEARINTIKGLRDDLLENSVLNAVGIGGGGDSGGDSGGGSDRAEMFSKRIQDALDGILGQLKTDTDFRMEDSEESKEAAAAETAKVVESLQGIDRSFILRLLDLDAQFENFQTDFAKANQALVDGVAEVKFPLSQFESIQTQSIKDNLQGDVQALQDQFAEALEVEKSNFAAAQASALEENNRISKAIAEEIAANAADQAALTDAAAKADRKFQSDLLLKQLDLQKKENDRIIAANREAFRGNTMNLGGVFQGETDKLAGTAVAADKARQEEAKAAEKAAQDRQNALEKFLGQIAGLLNVMAAGIADTSEEDAQAIADINQTAADAVAAAQQTANDAIKSEQDSLAAAQEMTVSTVADIEKTREDAIAAAELKREETIRAAIEAASTTPSADPSADIAKAEVAFRNTVNEAEKSRNDAIKVAEEGFMMAEMARNEAALQANKNIAEAEAAREQTVIEAQETAMKAVQEYQEGVTAASVDAGNQFAESAISQGVSAAVETFAPGFEQLVQPLLDVFSGSPEKIDDFIQGLVDGAVDFINVVLAKAPLIITSLIRGLVRAIPDLVTGILEAGIAAIPIIITAFIGLIPDLIGAAIDLVIEGVPRIIEALLLGIGDAFVAVINGVIEVVNRIPLVNIPLINTGDTQGPTRAQNTPTADPAGNLAATALQQDTLVLSEASRNTFDNTQAMMNLSGVIVENSMATKANTQQIGFESDVFGVPPELRPGFVAGGEAFNPFLDPTLGSEFDGRENPTQIQIQIGNQRLADLLLDLQESGYVQEVVVS